MDDHTSRFLLVYSIGWGRSESVEQDQTARSDCMCNLILIYPYPRNQSMVMNGRTRIKAR